MNTLRRIYLDEVVELIEWGASIKDVARRLGVHELSIYRVAQRRGTPAELRVIQEAMRGEGLHRPGQNSRARKRVA